jgi:hypothetical protein
VIGSSSKFLLGLASTVVLFSGPLGTNDNIFILSRHLCVFKWGLLLDREGVWVVLVTPPSTREITLLVHLSSVTRTLWLNHWHLVSGLVGATTKIFIIYHTFTCFKIGASCSMSGTVGLFLSYPCNRPWRPIGLWDVDAPTISRQLTHAGEAVSLKRRPPFTPRKIHGTHFC